MVLFGTTKKTSFSNLRTRKIKFLTWNWLIACNVLSLDQKQRIKLDNLCLFSVFATYKISTILSVQLDSVMFLQVKLFYCGTKLQILQNSFLKLISTLHPVPSAPIFYPRSSTIGEPNNIRFWVRNKKKIISILLKSVVHLTIFLKKKQRNALWRFILIFLH